MTQFASLIIIKHKKVKHMRRTHNTRGTRGYYTLYVCTRNALRNEQNEKYNEKCI